MICRHTFHTLSNASLDVCDAIAELLLRVAQILVGVCQVLDLIVQLFLHLRELLGGEGSKIDCF